jgi:hypothetical protein
MMRLTPSSALLLLVSLALRGASPALAGLADSTRAAPPGAAGVKIGTYVLPPEAPDSRAERDTTLTIEEQAKLDEKLRRERRTARIDSLHLNRHATLALHAAPAAERRTPAEIARLAADCANLVTAVPPGDWDVFVIAGGFDLLNGVAFAFQWPEDWIVRGFTQSPDLEVPFAMGELRASAARPYMIVFNCVASTAKESLVPAGVLYRNADLVVIGRLEITATSPGSLTIENHANPDYGPPEVANCWNTTADIAPPARGRIDVGSGPGARPCAGEKSPAATTSP